MDLKKRGFQLPEKMRFDEDTLTDTYGKLIAEPLERGFGITIGNSLRRVLLSSIEGAAVTAVRFGSVMHEFTPIPGVKEDAVDIILNVKGLEFAMDGLARSRTATVKVKGPAVVTGADFQLDQAVRLLNPERHVATVDKGSVFEGELYIEKGTGYVEAEFNMDEEYPVGVIPIDSNYSPVKKVNFTVEKARVGRSTDFDKLILEVWTNGAITPKAAISQAASIIIEHMGFFVFEHGEEGAEPDMLVSKGMHQEAIFNENLLKSVEELELSVRAHNCLKNADIKTIADLVEKSENEMLRTKNFGRKSLNEIKEIINGMGLDFGMRVDREALEKYKEKTNAS